MKITIAFAIIGFALGMSTIDARAQANQSKITPELERLFQSADENSVAAAIAAVEKIVAADPSDAKAVLWRGAGRLSQAGFAFRSGNFKEGSSIWGQGLADLQNAIDRQQDDVSFRLIRASVLKNAAKQFPVPEVARELRLVVVSDYERALKLIEGLQEKRADKGAILLALAEVHDKLGNKLDARSIYKQIIDQISDPALKESAVQWLRYNQQ